MYLHKFPAPKIYEYDTLASEEKWNEFYDIILANPPFMSPMGGIKPHKRFSIQAKRSEVLFVDYIAEHLNPNGRGGVIVPEGIIFQSGIAYRKLRKMLIENFLYAVVSLPAGVFNPYSGVKTSILFLNKNLAKKTDKILFVKVNHDGFGLGAQRREIKENDLPLVLEIINKYKQKIIENKEIEFNLNEAKYAHVVKKEKIAESGDYNFSGDRYKEAVVYNGKWDFVELNKICSLEYGKGLPKKDRIPGIYPVMGSNGICGYHNDYLIKGPAIIVGRKGSAGEVVWEDRNCFPIDTTYYIKLNDSGKVDLKYIYFTFKKLNLSSIKNGAGIPGLNRKDVYSKYKIPLPPLEIQEEIVAELDSYQKIIDGARQVVENYKPTFKIDPEWEMLNLGKICDVRDGTHDSPKYYQSGFPLITSKNIIDGKIDFKNVNYISRADLDKINRRSGVDCGDIIMPMIGTIGNPIIVKENREFAIKNVALIKFYKDSKINNYFLKFMLESEYFNQQYSNFSRGSTQRFISLGFIRELKIPLPPKKVQDEIVTQLISEQKIINANKELITIFENKIKDKIVEVWGEQ